MAWSIFTEAPNQTIAESWCRYVVGSGVPCRLYPGDISSFMGVTASGVRLMTEEAHVEQARALIHELKHARPTDDAP